MAQARERIPGLRKLLCKHGWLHLYRDIDHVLLCRLVVEKLDRVEGRNEHTVGFFDELEAKAA